MVENKKLTENKNFTDSNNHPKKDRLGYKSSVLDISQQNYFSTAQQVNLSIDFRTIAPAATNSAGYAPGFNIDNGQKQFDRNLKAAEGKKTLRESA